MPVTPYSYNGTPPDSLGTQGDQCIDYGNRLLWGPKGASSWSGTAVNIVGPTGPIGPSAALPVMTNVGSGYGPSSGFSGQSVPTGTQPCFFPGTTIPNAFTPNANSALTGVTAINFGSTGASVYVFLLNTTTNQVVMNIGSLGSGTVNNFGYSATTYPLVAGNTYQWCIQRNGAGVVFLQINPTYLFPSGTASNLSVYQPMVVASSTTVAKAGTINTTTPGMAQTGYYRNPNPSWLYQLDCYMAGSGVADPYITNQTASNANQFTADNYGYPTITSTLTRYTFGPFAPTTWPFTAGSQYTMNIYAPSGSLTISSAYILMTIGQ